MEISAFPTPLAMVGEVRLVRAALAVDPEELLFRLVHRNAERTALSLLLYCPSLRQRWGVGRQTPIGVTIASGKGAVCRSRR